MERTRPSNATATLLLLATLLAGCGVILRDTSPSPLELTAVAMDNGHLIELRADRRFGPATALVTSGGWLIVTIVDSLLDASDLRHHRSAVIDTLEVVYFPTAVQLSFHLTSPASSVEVTQDVGGSRVLISLFREAVRSRPRKR